MFDYFLLPQNITPKNNKMKIWSKNKIKIKNIWSQKEQNENLVQKKK